VDHGAGFGYALLAIAQDLVMRYLKQNLKKTQFTKKRPKWGRLLIKARE
jgi:hypothetical protein